MNGTYLACSAGWQPANQQYFFLTLIQHQTPAILLAIFFSHSKSGPTTSQPMKAIVRG
jgi:hypothetical protein